nr:immunoglobulin light chain junction region [Macaca mulatta]
CVQGTHWPPYIF